MPYAPSLTPLPDDDPTPRVEVFFESFHPDAATVTVWRSAFGREREVRGAVRAATAGALSRIDFEAPFNTPLSYRAEMFDATGLSLGFTDSATIGDLIVGLLPEDDLLPSDETLPEEAVAGTGLISARTWLHNPLNPQGAVAVELAGSTGGLLSRPVPAEVSYPLGRRVGVMLAEPRRGVAGLQFDVRVTTLEAADKVQALIDQTPVICIRLGGDEQRLRIPQPMFLGVTNIAEESINVFWGGEDTRQLMEGDEVDPPVPGLFIPLLSAADINVSFETAAELNAAHLRAVDVNRRYDLAGAANA